MRPLHWLILSLILATASFASASELERPAPSAAEPTSVYVKAFLVDIDDISSVEQNFSASVYLEFRWHDPSLAHDGSRAVTIPPSHPAYPGFKIVNSQRVIDSFGGVSGGAFPRSSSWRTSPSTATASASTSRRSPLPERCASSPTPGDPRASRRSSPSRTGRSRALRPARRTTSRFRARRPFRAS